MSGARVGGESAQSSTTVVDRRSGAGSHVCYNRGADPALRLHPNAPGPANAALGKERLRPSTPPIASRSCARSDSTNLEDRQDYAHALQSAQTTPRYGRGTATTHASNPIIASPSCTPENRSPKQIQITTIYNCSTRRVDLKCGFTLVLG